MIDVRQGGPGEVEIEIERELDKIAWGEGVVENDDQIFLTLWLDTSRALDLAEKLKDIVQAMDDARKEV